MMTMTISKEVLDELLSGVENADDLLGNQGLMKELKVRLMERMLGAELTEHLGYEPETQPADYQSNRRNGTTRKTLKGNDGALPIDVPRDRDGSFEPELIKKGQTRIDGMDDKIIHCPAGDCKAICREGGSTPLAFPPVTSALILRRFMA
jgi:transposase-like protein